MNNNGNRSLKRECDYNSADSHTGAEFATVKQDKCKLYVAGIKKSVGNVPLCQVFRKFGVVTEAFNTRQGFGFVTFSNIDEAQNCIKTLNGREVFGQEIYIAPAKQKRNVDKVSGDSSKRKDKDGIWPMVRDGMGQNQSLKKKDKELSRKPFEWINSGNGIGRKLMEMEGWRDGESVGIKGNGLKRALDGRDFGQCSRYGLGFGNYLLNNNNVKKKKMLEKPCQAVLANKRNQKSTLKNGKFIVKKCKTEFTLNEKVKKEDMVSLEAKIKIQLQAGKFNEAFQTALSASYSGLVIYTCEMLHPIQLFNQEKCPLTQSVLLSLIQKLCVDFQDKMELKLRYLFEAVVNLDVTNPTIKKHIAGAMAGLRAALHYHIQTNPSSKLTANMRMLQMAIQFKTDVVRVLKIDV